MSALTKRQRDLLLFIQRYADRHGQAPSYTEMADALELASKSGINRLIVALEERGYISRLAHRARCLLVTRRIEDPDKPQVVSAAAAYRDTLRLISVGVVEDPVAEARRVLERYP